NQPLWKA
ncbi:bacterial Na+/H+ antiporter B family protein, partial [Vibrio parahaemolyticus V-223/04]